jgi:hypothetical protein
MKPYEVIGVDARNGVLALEIRSDLLAPLANYLFRYREPEQPGSENFGRRFQSSFNRIHGLARVLQGASQICHVRPELQEALAQQLGIELLDPPEDELNEENQELCETSV